MSTILFTFWWLYLIAFVVGAILPVKNSKKRIRIAVIMAVVSLMPMALLFLTVSGPGAGLVAVAPMFFGLISCFILTGFASGVFCRSVLANGQINKLIISCVILLPFPLIFVFAAQVLENKTKQEELNAKNELWQKQSDIHLGDVEFSLPVSPKQHWVYKTHNGGFSGANIGAEWDRDTINATLKNEPSLITLKSLVIKPVSPSCDFNNLSYSLRNFCFGGASMAVIKSWCELNPDWQDSLWCDTQGDARKYQIHFYTGESATSMIKDGDCLKSVCYYQMDMTNIVSATISFNENNDKSNARDGRVYAKKLWDEITAFGG